jgi:hypothetical protein
MIWAAPAAPAAAPEAPAALTGTGEVGEERGAHLLWFTVLPIQNSNSVTY